MVSDGVSSANEIKQNSVGTVTRKLRVLDMNVVKTILEGMRKRPGFQSVMKSLYLTDAFFVLLSELRTVDVNFDGRYVLK